MPPKAKISKQDVIKTALSLAQSGGEGAINARDVASVLGCSTQPIFSNFATMDDLVKAVRDQAYVLYGEYISREVKSGKYPEYKAFGMAYIRFAEQEKNLFKMLFMCDRRGKDLSPTADFDASVDLISRAIGVDKKTAEQIHFELWAFVHGIATMFATYFLTLGWDDVSEMLTDVYKGIVARHLGDKSK